MKISENVNWKIVVKLLIKQFLDNRLLMGVILGITFFLIVTLSLISFFTGIPIASFTRDPIALSNIPFYSGFFSQLGNIFWFLAAGITIFTYRISLLKFKRFLLFSTIFSLLLGIDDLFLIHDGLFPAIGFNENWMYLLYALYAIYYFTAFYKFLLKTPFLFLIMACSFLGLSVLLDLIKIPGLHPYILEDGFKMAGILTWTLYYYKSSVFIVQKTSIKQQMQFYIDKRKSEDSNNLKKVAGE